ncbi:MAG TPA: DUF1365 domain-containing protein [Rhodanobacteraceae bacterium]|nr:DUF1365 domain-containing protein [Rhodanobacteraceae bacterium]
MNTQVLTRDPLQPANPSPVSAATGNAPANPEGFRSAIYEGWVRHRRLAPHAHAFRYRVAMLYLDLAEIESVFAGRWLWSAHARNVAQFRRSDYLGPPELPLDEAVRRRVAAATKLRPRGPIRLLTHLRYLGHNFNPVSFYYCYAEDGRTLQAIVAEITNTPWKERHAYVLPVRTAQAHGRALGWQFAKAFHVSPFMPMDRDYAWRFTAPAEDLFVHMDVLSGAAREFDATLTLRRRPLDGRGLARVLLRYPAMTLKIVAAIHWQALLIFLRRNPVYDHPDIPKGGSA